MLDKHGALQNVVQNMNFGKFSKYCQVIDTDNTDTFDSLFSYVLSFSTWPICHCRLKTNFSWNLRSATSTMPSCNLLM